MAIFIALIFQVLFVLFAMAINVALVVHDKINLQNAVDLAAYYAAQRQAEILNVIAHENYMIRQSWKLLAWRYRVIGSMGQTKSPMTHPVWTKDRRDLPFTGWPGSAGAGEPGRPVACVRNGISWQEFKGADKKNNECDLGVQAIPALPLLPNVAPFLPWNRAFSQITSILSARVSRNCDFTGAYNRWFALVSLQAFRQDQRNRKQVIYALARNLSKGDFTDLDGKPVSEGTLQTYKKNLTFTNNESQVGFRIFNSLQGRQITDWLSEIKVSPTLLYLDPPAGGGCSAGISPVAKPPNRGGFDQLAGYDELQAWANDALFNNEYQFSHGVEKNPWIMAYMGVQAETSPRQIFFPLGDSVKITARAFAKPFGGRIGPWYSARWPRGSLESKGSKEERIDKLIPTRTQADGLLDSDKDFSRLPNHSRFPGDRYGIATNLALNSIQGLERPDILSYNWYVNSFQEMRQGGGARNDPLADLPAGDPNLAVIRKYEIAAVSPDLFDVTYYSIEPNFSGVYLPKLLQNRVALGIPDSVPIRGDLGSSPRVNLLMSVKDQLTIAIKSRVPEDYYSIRDKTHILTAWTSGEFAFDYANFPVERFGKCEFPDDASANYVPVPGSCASRGGRTGYSVKLVSRDYLFSGALPLGGPNEATGAIFNPPPANEGW